MAEPPFPLSVRSPRSHKGDFGRVLLVGGSRGMAGSIALAGMAALRSGAGLVTLAVPDCCLETVASYHPCLMTVPLPDDGQGKLAEPATSEIFRLAEKATVMAIGPGLGQSEPVRLVVAEIYRQIVVPLVCDADGLNALAKRRAALGEHAGERILTPHPGEFARLTRELPQTREQRIAAATRLARTAKATVLLKGHQTVVAQEEKVYVNETGNPGMATGGSGDVLTGIITSLVGQRLDAWEAVCLGAYLHGRAGDLAAAEKGQAGMIASDLIDYLPAAWREL